MTAGCFRKIFVVTAVLVLTLNPTLSLLANDSDVEDRLLDFPAALYRQKDYYRAITEALRWQILAPEKARQRKMGLLLVRSYFQLEDYVRLKTAALDILQQPLGYTEQDRRETALLLVRSYFKNDREKQARETWENYLKQPGEGVFPTADSVSGQIDPERAATYSAVLPGAGLLLTGEYGKAATSFLLNAGFLWGTYRSYQDGAYGIAALLFFFEMGWYKGGMNAARESAENYNRRRVNAARQKWLEYQLSF